MADTVKRLGADICGLNEVYGAGELPLFNHQAHGDGSLCSFPSHAPDRRIDYIFVRGVACTAADVPQIVSADHCPHTADVKTP